MLMTARVIVVGTVYTVKEVAPSKDSFGDDGIALFEAKPAFHPKFFKAFRFRPIVTKTQEEDLALFTPLLTTTHQHA